MRKFYYPAIAGLAIIIIAFGSYVIVAQSAISGTWRASTNDEKSGSIQLSFERRSDKGNWQNGSSFQISDLAGLTAENIRNGKVSFRLVREAGTIECEGSFVDGKGSGTFRFLPDLGYLASMKSR